MPGNSRRNRQPKAEPSHVTYSDFRESLAAYMDQVWNSRTPLHVTRQGGRSVVVLSEEEFGGWLETVHLFRSPANVRRLLESIVAANAGLLTKRELIESGE